jgi:hypothetical protein
MYLTIYAQARGFSFLILAIIASEWAKAHLAGQIGFLIIFTQQLIQFEKNQITADFCHCVSALATRTLGEHSNVDGAHLPAERNEEGA